MSNETTALTVEQAQEQAQAEKAAKEAAKEARLDQMVAVLQDLFKENRIEKKGGRIAITAIYDSFLGSDITKASAVSTLFGNSGYYISASIANGLQIILF